MYGQNLCGVQGGTTVTPSTVRLGTGGERPGRGTLWRWFADAVWMVSMQSYVVVVPTAPDSTTKDSDWVKWICSGGACPDQNMRLRSGRRGTWGCCLPALIASCPPTYVARMRTDASSSGDGCRNSRMNEPSKRTCGPPSGLGSRGSFCDGRDIGTVGMMTMGSLGGPASKFSWC